MGRVFHARLSRIETVGTRLRSILRHSRLMQSARFGFYSLAYALWARLRPIDPQLVLFLSDSRAGFTGNFAFLKREVHRQSTSTRVVGVFKPKLGARRPLRELLALPQLMAQARTIVLDDYYPLIYPIRIRQGQTLLQVWHAAGAFKRVGFSRKGRPGGPTRHAIHHKNYTAVAVSSESVRRDYAEAFGVDISRVHATGVARTDAFFDGALVAESSAKVRERYGIGVDTKIVLIAPTFRGVGQLVAYYDYDNIDWSHFATQLGDDWVVLVRMHPFVQPLSYARPQVSGVIDVSHDREITELLMSADVLVTDYSSTIFEFALLRRPIVFFCPDLEQYTADRDFYYPFEDYIVGPLVAHSEDLAAAIASASVDERLDDFVERFCGACDGHSSQRITESLILWDTARLIPPFRAG